MSQYANIDKFDVPSWLSMQTKKRGVYQSTAKNLFSNLSVFKTRKILTRTGTKTKTKFINSIEICSKNPQGVYGCKALYELPILSHVLDDEDWWNNEENHTKQLEFTTQSIQIYLNFIIFFFNWRISIELRHCWTYCEVGCSPKNFRLVDWENGANFCTRYSQQLLITPIDFYLFFLRVGIQAEFR